jgi:hypothetical protein
MIQLLDLFCGVLRFQRERRVMFEEPVYFRQV